MTSVQSAGPQPLQWTVLSVRELLGLGGLAIPQYQRPYRWTAKNILQLFADIAVSKDKPSYRLGTIVFHQHRPEDSEAEVWDIVDGQQRTLTLLLTVRALLEKKRAKLAGEELKKELYALERETTAKLESLRFKSEISKANLRQNYEEIVRIIEAPEFTEEQITFLLHRCEVVTFTLGNLSEAFQFFDSQNARGRDLEPHDLLKAYHLREFSERDEALKAETVAQWESSETADLAELFAQYLYRIRNWSRGESARYFGKEDAGLFKGVSLENSVRFPYLQPLRMAHSFVDEYVGHYARKVDGSAMAFPFQLDQIILNGRRFFEMTAYYQHKVAAMRKGAEDDKMEERARRILKELDQYEGRHRTGDRYVRTMFDCLLLYYRDKFGDVELSRAVEKCFLWAYGLRLTLSRVMLASMDKYVLGKNLFRVLRTAIRPSDFLHYPLSKVAVEFEKAAAIEKLFREMNYAE